MGKLIRVVPKGRQEDTSRDDFTDHTGDIYVQYAEAEDGFFSHNIYTVHDAATTADFGALKRGDWLIDLSSAAISIRVKETNVDEDAFTVITTTT